MMSADVRMSENDINMTSNRYIKLMHVYSWYQTDVGRTLYMISTKLEVKWFKMNEYNVWEVHSSINKKLNVKSRI